MKPELVHRENNKAFTDSLIVAKEFNKRPEFINRKINVFLESSVDELKKFGRLNFEPIFEAGKEAQDKINRLKSLTRLG